MEFRHYIKNNKIGRIIENISFSELNTIGLGGNIRYVVYPKNFRKLKKLLKKIKKDNKSYYISGFGSNLYTKKFDGVLIKLDDIKRKFKIKKDIHLSANYSLSQASRKLIKENISSLISTIGIPGSLGGAIYMNAGFSNYNVSDHLKKIRILTPNNKVKWIKKSGCEFKYRYSSFMNNKSIILEAKFFIVKDLNIQSKCKELLIKRYKSQPVGKSLGSIYKNTSLYYAGEVIERLGFKGFTHKGIKISEKHANIWINQNGHINDLLELLFIVELSALLKLNIRLKREIIEF